VRSPWTRTLWRTQKSSSQRGFSRTPLERGGGRPQNLRACPGPSFTSEPVHCLVRVRRMAGPRLRPPFLLTNPSLLHASLLASSFAVVTPAHGPPPTGTPFPSWVLVPQRNCTRVPDARGTSPSFCAHERDPPPCREARRCWASSGDGGSTPRRGQVRGRDRCRAKQVVK